MAISKEQTEFIENKVKELKTIEAVKQLYKTDSPVDKLANRLAKKLNKTTPKLKRREGK
jgi:hypothetical protein